MRRAGTTKVVAPAGRCINKKSVWMSLQMPLRGTSERCEGGMSTGVAEKGWHPCVFPPCMWSPAVIAGGDFPRNTGRAWS